MATHTQNNAKHAKVEDACCVNLSNRQLAFGCVSYNSHVLAFLALWKRNQSQVRARVSLCVTTVVLCGTATGAIAAPASEPELKIGVVQRFGAKPTDVLSLQATAGDRLTIQTKTKDKEKTLQATNVKLETVMEPLPKATLAERVVLSTHRSFETAEHSARQWQKMGIEVEIAQPERWQVWAKRDVYNSPLLRRFLLLSLQVKGNRNAYLDTQVLQQVPQVNLVVDGQRYTYQEIDITTNKNLIQVSEGKNQRDLRLYAGRMRLQPNAYGTYTLVNEVPLETYLRGVVPHEIGANVPYSAVEAQAIIARTYALRNLRRFTIDNYELCADTQCQVYRGLSGTVPLADRAIAATKGKVLTYNNQLVDALYSSTTGGVTAAFSDVWQGTDRPYLQPVIDAAGSVWNLSGQSLAEEKNFQRFIGLQQGFNEAGWSMFRWRQESSLVQITQDLQRFFKANNSPWANLKQIYQMQVTERSPSGRILKLAVQTDIGTVVLEKDEVRSAFAAPRSTLFYLQPLNKGTNSLWGYAFVGGGFGHGVGLSQTGSQRLARLGWSSARILNFYYPGTQIETLSDRITFYSDEAFSAANKTK
ncbi:SpoIID/LytB domain-containing protein [Chroogloeocystis siderophila]|jgi:SpoIID/LytB domain protein|uniref:Amidase n=1 Tax=Chroogloeocystis siderophila 5.2 s.c.1 TaxID=247279 RepID=A0A1U7HIM8_9CHRO|nr:SpoIID/LytB domain-containing protein [Chroogloeocystis siderophila]OKH23411.1 amidase [Chroogloeocystis siderophila 5.2 s.c.1]